MNHYLSDIVSLQLLISLENTKSIGKTARMSGLSQPAVSMRLKNFETRMGIQLFSRDPNGTVLTEAGRTVCIWAKTVIDLIENYDYTINALKENINGQLTLGASQTIADYIMPQTIKLFKDSDQKTAVKLEVTNSMQVIKNVTIGSISLGFVESLTKPFGCHSKIVGDDELFVVVRNGHKFSKRKFIDINDLYNSHLVIREEGSGTREVFDALFGSVKFKSAPTELSSTTAIKAAITHSDEVSILSKIAIKTELQNSTLKILKLKDLKNQQNIELKRQFRAVWRSDKVLTRSQEHFISLTSAVIKTVTAGEIQVAKSNLKHLPQPTK